MTSLTHVALHVADIEAVADFYRRYCDMQCIHERRSSSKCIYWLAEPGRETELIFVLMSGGSKVSHPDGDYSHLGFALETREAVDQIADKARDDGILLWEPRQDDYPVGYYCGVLDPNGNQVEFSHGQPLGPGAPEQV